MLSLNRDVEVVKLLYLLPDGRRIKRLCAGCEGSAMIFFAFLITRCQNIDRLVETGRI